MSSYFLLLSLDPRRQAEVFYLDWKRSSGLLDLLPLTTVLLRTPIAQMIFFNQGMLLLGSNHFLIKFFSIWRNWYHKKKGPYNNKYVHEVISHQIHDRNEQAKTSKSQRYNYECIGRILPHVTVTSDSSVFFPRNFQAVVILAVVVTRTVVVFFIFRGCFLYVRVEV